VRAPWLACAGAVFLSGCALLGKSAPVVPRYFTPEYDVESGPPGPRSELRLRLGRVEGWSHLRERFVVRSATREIVRQEDRLWLERPEVYLRRALARALFEERGLVEALSGRAITLEVELIAFEEVVQPHRARIQAHVLLRDDRIALLTETVTVEQPVASVAEADPARATVLAYSQALQASVARIADRVVARLTAVDATGAGR
jgi:ABC-type uncharacterized transport system auxiliary subunit